MIQFKHGAFEKLSCAPLAARCCQTLATVETDCLRRSINKNRKIDKYSIFSNRALRGLNPVQRRVSGEYGQSGQGARIFDRDVQLPERSWRCAAVWRPDLSCAICCSVNRTGTGTGILASRVDHGVAPRRRASCRTKISGPSRVLHDQVDA